MKELKAVILEKQQELERSVAQYDSLCKVEAEQRSLIEKLQNREI